MKKKHTRNDIPRRFRAARSTATVKTIKANMERDYGLPRGSVSVKNHDGSTARADKKIGKLVKEYPKSK